MTIFRSSLALGASLLSTAALATPIQIEPRSAVEAMALLEVSQAQDALKRWVNDNAGHHDLVIEQLLAAGFVPENGLPGCRFFGYYRETDDNGAARRVSLALCTQPGDPMVLVLDMLPPKRRGAGAEPLMIPRQQK